MIRVTFLLRRKAELDREQFQKYWREQHGPLVASHAADLGMLRYVQVHGIEDPINEAMAKARGGMEAPYDGVAEVWFENRDVLTEVLQTEAGQQAAAALLEDEARFIDLPRSPLWLGYEYPQVNPSPETLVARPHNNVVKLYFPLRCPEGMDPEAAQFYPSSAATHLLPACSATCRSTGLWTMSWKRRCGSRVARKWRHTSVMQRSGSTGP
jgi:uncharacterized protein (TIGR02118 family)